MTAPLLELQGISKAFGGIHALERVDLRLDAGQVHALIGKNGAGKSTLIKVLGGVVRPDSGAIRLGGTEVSFGGPAAALSRGVAIVHQELSMVPDMSVAENLMLGTWPRTRFGQIDRNRMQAIASDALAKVGCDVAANADLRALSIANRQLVEIARAMLRKPRILVFDEPTSSLSDGDAERIVSLARKLAGQGVGIIYISHRLAEIEALADVVTVLRDGKSVASRPMAGLDRRQIVELMIGDQPLDADPPIALSGSTPSPATPKTQGPPVLRIRGLSRPGILHDISFDLYPGEILGLAGLVGAGRTELVRAIFGRDAILSGEVEIGGQLVTRPTPRRMRSLGIGFIPEDRKGQGLVLGLSVKHNAGLAALARLSTFGVMNAEHEQAMVQEQITSLQVKTPGLDIPVAGLSGGNQQKVVLAKWLMRRPRILILDEPTRGVDVQAKAQIFAILRELAAEGTAIIMISSELEEVLSVSHRIITMARGRLIAESQACDTSLRDILLAAAGT